ncbi:MAG: hypothetical protein IPL28_01765 [Chloroflexi bacterium]|nr:hypothetical protein [Chloroflexota bacterium]
MRRFLVVAALLLLVIPAASPYFGAGVPRTNDLFPHLHRTFALGQALEWGGSLYTLVGRTRAWLWLPRF